VCVVVSFPKIKKKTLYLLVLNRLIRSIKRRRRRRRRSEERKIEVIIIFSKFSFLDINLYLKIKKLKKNTDVESIKP